MKCDIGPLTKTFGKTPWLVYGCADQKSVVVVSAHGSPAMPFVFIFASSEDGYKLHGEGTGDKSATAAAFDELKAFSSADIQALFTAVETAAVTLPTGQ